MIDGIPHRVRTGVQWRDQPERFGPWKTAHERHRLWSANGTWERLLQQVQAEADAVGEIDWDISVDSTVVRAHQHAAGARLKGGISDRTPGRNGVADLVARLVEVGQCRPVRCHRRSVQHSPLTTARRTDPDSHRLPLSEKS